MLSTPLRRLLRRLALAGLSAASFACAAGATPVDAFGDLDPIADGAGRNGLVGVFAVEPPRGATPFDLEPLATLAAAGLRSAPDLTALGGGALGLAWDEPGGLLPGEQAGRAGSVAELLATVPTPASALALLSAIALLGLVRAGPAFRRRAASAPPPRP